MGVETVIRGFFNTDNWSNHLGRYQVYVEGFAFVILLVTIAAAAFAANQVHGGINVPFSRHWYPVIVEKLLPWLTLIGFLGVRAFMVVPAVILSVGIVALFGNDIGTAFETAFKALLTAFVGYFAFTLFSFMVKLVCGLTTLTWDLTSGLRVGRRPQADLQEVGPYSQSQAAGQESGLSVVAERPRTTYSDISGMADLKAKLLEAAGPIVEQARSRKGSQKPASNGILLHGEPGNGKTAFAEALAGELRIKIISVSIADLKSRWIGETTERLVAAFRSAEQQAPCMLFVDEVDSILRDRSAGGATADDINTTNTFLTEVVRLRGKGVVIMAATNFIEQLDAAAIREGRFDFKIEVPPPDEEARLGLLRVGLQKNAGRVKVDEAVLRNVAKRWQGFSVSRLLAVTKEVPKYVQDGQKRQLDFDDFIALLRRVQGRANRVPESTKAIGDLLLAPGQRRVLMGIAGRMRRAFETEELGGTLPNGVLFWGPPGTGKTEAARSLAKETGWAFLTTTGNDLIQDSKAIDSLYRKAQEARPAIVFIDEADDVLGNRQYSNVRSVTNKLLTVMDGVGGRIPDLLFVAATNHPDVLDPAVLRGGRFTEKVAFAPPQATELAGFVLDWLQRKGWTLQGDVTVLAQSLEGRSIADVQSVLQAAVNLTISQAHADGADVVRVVREGALRTAIQAVVPDFDA